MDEVATHGSRGANRLRLLEALQHGPARSRTELGRTLGLSRGTVTMLLGELERGVWSSSTRGDDDDAPPRAGRPPLHVSLAASAAFAVGLDLGHGHIAAAVCDLGGGIVADRWRAADVEHEPAVALDLAAGLIAEIVAEADVEPGRIIGVGAGDRGTGRSALPGRSTSRSCRRGATSSWPRSSRRDSACPCASRTTRTPG